MAVRAFERSLLFTSAAILLATAVPTTACSWVDGGIPRNIRNKQASADATIHGVLVKTSTGRVCNAEVLQLHFQVRGASGIPATPGDTVIIGTPTSSAACGVSYALGTEVVVFAGGSPHFCQSPVSFPYTMLPNANVVNPSAAQLDSLEFEHPLRTLAPAAASRHSLRPAFTSGRLTFSAGQGPDAAPRGADGRAVEAAVP